jgi:hypothetical protein
MSQVSPPSSTRQPIPEDHGPRPWVPDAGADAAEEQGGGEQDHAEDVVGGPLDVPVRGGGLGRSLRLQALGLGRGRQAVLGVAKGVSGASGFLSGLLAIPGLHWVKVATSISVWLLARFDQRVDSTRAALARLNALACSPVQRLAW